VVTCKQYSNFSRLLYIYDIRKVLSKSKSNYNSKVSEPHGCLSFRMNHNKEFSRRLRLVIISTIIVFHLTSSVSGIGEPQKPSTWYKFLIRKFIDMEDQQPEVKAVGIPLVINTWGFSEATQLAWKKLQDGGSVLDAVEVGCTRCEELQCDRTVGFGGSPDENGETTLDALIMDGETHSSGAVACLRRIKPAISVARKVMEHTRHSMLAGDLATAFAIKMGFKEESLTTVESAAMHTGWKNNSCQPNFWKNVFPDPSKYCGPYSPVAPTSSRVEVGSSERKIDRFNHDTISMIAIDRNGKIASGTSSNGARNKIPGRVGDAPIVGAGSYVDKDVGGAAATGDGDIMMRFLPSLIAVEKMREGMKPKDAAMVAIGRISKVFPSFSGALVAANLAGEYGAACHGLPGGFPFSVVNEELKEVKVETTNCTMSTN